jgi:predicted enzyme related to lactoylglutathione lyase
MLRDKGRIPPKEIPMNWLNLLSCTIVASAAVAALAQDPKTPPKAAPDMAPKTKLAHVDAFAYDGSSILSVPVKDMKAAQAWYGKVLGTSVFYELAEQGWCELTTSVPNTMIGLSQNGEVKPSNGSAISLGVKDMTKAKAWLVKNGVKLEGDVVEIPKTVKLLYFSDPDGNRLLFYEPYTAQ